MEVSLEPSTHWINDPNTAIPFVVRPSRFKYAAIPPTAERDVPPTILSGLKVLERHPERARPSPSMNFVNRL